MKKSITQYITLVLVLIVICFRYFSQWCILSNPSCYGTWIHQTYNYITSPSYFFSLYLLPLAIVLVFISRSVFNSWLKLAVWFVPLSVIMIALTPVSWTGIGLNLFPFYRDDMARLTAEVFTALSLALIIWKYIVARRAR